MVAAGFATVAHKGDIYVYPSSSTPGVAGTLAILAYKKSLKLMGPGLVHHNTCPADPGFDFSSKTATHLSAVPSIYGDPGVYISISLTAGASATATLSVAVTGGVSAVIASASATYGISFAVSITASVPYGGAWTVPTTAPHHGWLGAGAYSDNLAWAYGHYSGASCTWVVTTRGTTNGPYLLPYIWKGVG